MQQQSTIMNCHCLTVILQYNSIIEPYINDVTWPLNSHNTKLKKQDLSLARTHSETLLSFVQIMEVHDDTCISLRINNCDTSTLSHLVVYQILISDDIMVRIMSNLYSEHDKLYC